jgi:hypothetical protein
MLSEVLNRDIPLGDVPSTPIGHLLYDEWNVVEDVNPAEGRTLTGGAATVPGDVLIDYASQRSEADVKGSSVPLYKAVSRVVEKGGLQRDLLGRKYEIWNHSDGLLAVVKWALNFFADGSRWLEHLTVFQCGLANGLLTADEVIHALIEAEGVLRSTTSVT